MVLSHLNVDMCISKYDLTGVSCVWIIIKQGLEASLKSRRSNSNCRQVAKGTFVQRAPWLIFTGGFCDVRQMSSLFLLISAFGQMNLLLGLNHKNV